MQMETVVVDYQVCWKCQALLTSQQIHAHLEKCHDNFNQRKLPYKHYVCDQLDFCAMNEIKRYLTTEFLAIILKHRRDLLAMGFSIGFINLLLNFGSKLLDQGNHVNSNIHESEKTHDDNTLSRKEKMHESDVDPKNVRVQNDLLTDKEKNQLAQQCKNTQNGSVVLIQCKLCDHQSKSAKLMLRHLSCHDNGKCFVCESCGYSTPLRSKWNQHRCRKTEKNKHLLCEKCHELFHSKVALSHHIVIQHTDCTNGAGTKVFKCKECPYVGRDLSSLSDHQRKHTGDYLTCTKPDCSFKTPYKRGLQQHLRQKHAAEKFQVCHVCGFQTRHVASLRAHMMRHEEGTKRYKCTQCSFSSHNSTDLVLHLQRKHLKENKLSCTKCTFQTVYPVVLKKHLARHEQRQNVAVGELEIKKKRKKEHKCSFCNQLFKSVFKMLTHMEECNTMMFQGPPTISDLESSKVYEVQTFDGREMYNFDDPLDAAISAEVYNITSNMLDHDSESKNTFTAIVEDSLGSSRLTQDGYVEKGSDSVTTCKGRNPMLAETTRTLADSPLLEESLFNLMSDFPRPPTLNRCQSASTLMFASLSPHLVDRPLTPDFLSENPASSFFQGFV